MMSRILLFAMLSSAALWVPSPSQAKVDVDIEIAPPVAVYEAPPPPRAGYVWVQGYWDWDAHRHQHVWRKGHYVQEHKGEHWVPYAWVEHDGRYRLNEGHWEHGPGRQDDRH
ncbi:MAG TPA: hypothetical protein VF420_03100 [Casimicrobiaceae bacterium]